ncbi:MAG: hypothetical protein ACOCU7_00130, partial [Tangfeifania sp.]
VAQFAQKKVGYYAVCSVCTIPGIAGERMRGSSLMITIRPVLHTGQRQGLTPVSLAKRSTFVSGGFCCFMMSSISGFFYILQGGVQWYANCYASIPPENMYQPLKPLLKKGKFLKIDSC